jgi:hypothetical protein
MGSFTYGRAHAGYSLFRGDVFICRPHKPQKLLRDLGYLKMERLMKEYRVDDDLEQMVSDLETGKLHSLYRCVVVEDPPPWYNDVVFEDIDPRYAPDPGFHKIGDIHVYTGDYVILDT